MRNGNKKDTRTKGKFSKSQKFVKEEPRKDSRDPRVNFDNTRKSKFEKDLKNLYARGDSNDIRWYTKNTARIQAAGRLPFSAINGLTIVSDDGTNLHTVPGVMRISYAPNFIANQTVIEQAYQNLYSDIVHANSRNQSYDYTDLAIMMNAGVELFAAIALGIRAYGLMRRYQEENVYYPNLILEAAGYDYDDLRVNYSHMWDDILLLIAQSRQIWIPNTMPIVERRLWMNLNVYGDSNSVKAQLFLYTPYKFYKYVGYTDKKGGFIQAYDKDIYKLKWAEYLTMVQDMINALIPDQDRGIMYGDILKAYGKEGIFAMNDIALDYTTSISYNPEVLWQIENATKCPGHPVTFRQDNLHLYQDYTTIGTNHFAAGATQSSILANTMAPPKVLLNFHQPEQPTPEQITIATRMSCAGARIVDYYSYNTTSKRWEKHATDKCYVPEVAGTETVVIIEMYARQQHKGTKAWSTLIMPYNTQNANMMAWSAFDWAPSLYFLKQTGKVEDFGNVLIDSIYTEYENYMYAESSELGRLHDAVVYSLYNVPTL